ncbi:MAG: PD40 domain-containing protein [Chrysiogenetes bacterium]|nr:PD40 domain-containing protein [Chrysiogenetes bacterium]
MFKRFAIVLLMLAAVTAQAGLAHASEPILNVYRTGVRKLRVAIPSFVSMTKDEETREFEGKLAARLRKSVARSGVLEVIDPKAYIENVEEVGVLPHEQVFSNWSIINADALAKGVVGRQDDTWVVELRLYDVGLKKFRKGKRFRGTQEQLYLMADRFADVMVQELTGAEGISFGRIAFVSDTSGTKEIYEMKIDATDVRKITDNGSINLSPHYSRDGEGMYFTSYIRRGKPHIYFYEMLTGRLTPFWMKGSLNLGAVESPDGRYVALVQDDGSGNTHIILHDKESGTSRALNEGYGISVTPSWSPDGKQIAYVSDRSGAPHIYVVGINDGTPRRLTFQGRYNTSPSWSPKGTEIAFVRREEGELNLYVIDTEGANEIQLTSGARSNEDPSWSPNGDYLVFSSNRRGNYDLYLMGAGGHFVHRLTSSGSNETHPVWAPRER